MTNLNCSFLQSINFNMNLHVMQMPNRKKLVICADKNIWKNLSAALSVNRYITRQLYINSTR